MTDLKFEFSWDDPKGAKAPELRATWASLRIRVGDEVVTHLFDRRLNSVRDSVFLPLYPIAEWIALNWWNLLYENPAPRGVQESYPHRHSLRYAREGFALPDLSLEPAGQSLILRWRAGSMANYRLEFLRSGRGHVAIEDAKGELTAFVQSVIERLRQQDVQGTLLEEEWSAIESADEEEQEFCIAAASLGTNPYEIAEQQADTIVEIGDLLPPSLLPSFFQSADISRLRMQVEGVLGAIRAVQSAAAGVSALSTLRERLQIRDRLGKPWEEGYEYARKLRSELKVENEVLGSWEDLGRAFSISENDLTSAVHEAPAQGLFDALVAASQGGPPGFAIDEARKRVESRKFAFCRGLFEFLVSGNGGPLLVTGASTDRQKRNRAFAAEFLAPAHLLRERVSGAVIDGEDIEDLATSFQVSAWVIEHQLKNHQLVQDIIE